MEQHKRERRDARSRPRPYVRPALREFGEVGQLTQSGTAGKTEVGSLNNPNRARP